MQCKITISLKNSITADLDLHFITITVNIIAPYLEEKMKPFQTKELN